MPPTQSRRSFPGEVWHNIATMSVEWSEQHWMKEAADGRQKPRILSELIDMDHSSLSLIQLKLHVAPQIRCGSLNVEAHRQEYRFTGHAPPRECFIRLHSGCGFRLQ